MSERKRKGSVQKDTKQKKQKTNDGSALEYKPSKSSDQLNQKRKIATRKKAGQAKELDKYSIDEYTFEPGQDVMVRLISKKSKKYNRKLPAWKEFAIGKIRKITQQGNEDPDFELQWFIFPQELHYKNQCIGKDELFLTNKQQTIKSSCIDGPCYVLSLQDYETRCQSESADQSPYFYYRAKWLTSKNSLQPPIKEWQPRSCYCNKPTNPDLEYVECVGCHKWFHLSCAKIQKDEADVLDWNCAKCTEKLEMEVENDQGATHDQNQDQEEGLDFDKESGDGSESEAESVHDELQQEQESDAEHPQKGKKQEGKEVEVQESKSYSKTANEAGQRKEEKIDRRKSKQENGQKKETESK